MNYIVAVIHVNTAQSFLPYFSAYLLYSFHYRSWRCKRHGSFTMQSHRIEWVIVVVQWVYNIYSLVPRLCPAFHRLQRGEPGNEATVHISWTNISCHAMQQFCYFEKQDLAIMRESTFKTQDKVILLMNWTPRMHFVHIVQGHQKMWGN